MTQAPPKYNRSKIALWILSALLLILFPACLIIGSVNIPFNEVLNILIGNEATRKTWEIIVLETRLPMACTAMLAGAALSVAGLLLQTTFDNPLAGPSILGVSTGSSLGVAIVMLALGGSIGHNLGSYVSILFGALLGAGIIILTLLAFSSIVKSSIMLLIIGILVSHLASSAISLLNFFSTQEGVHSFVIWGLGNFSGVTFERLPIFASLIIISLSLSLLLVKPLNALLLGARYAENLGVNIRSTRNKLLVLSGILTAVVTAFCGPIGFIGLIVPHIARLALKSSNHVVLLPATALCGAVIALLCSLISVLPISSGVIPINAITPIIGVPIIIYIILNRKRILYFN
ncbi:MAG: iron ABC transporter permease [Muribaculaceae bacterium]|nr:iron ABC transporter permease [Muribaculaceae bacterium]